MAIWSYNCQICWSVFTMKMALAWAASCWKGCNTKRYINSNAHSRKMTLLPIEVLITTGLSFPEPFLSFLFPLAGFTNFITQQLWTYEIKANLLEIADGLLDFTSSFMYLILDLQGILLAWKLKSNIELGLGTKDWSIRALTGEPIYKRLRVITRQEHLHRLSLPRISDWKEDTIELLVVECDTLTDWLCARYLFHYI